jgi:hypothetical protein
MNDSTSKPLANALTGPWFEAYISISAWMGGPYDCNYLRKYVGSAKYYWYSRQVAEHNSVWSVTHNRPILLMQSFLDNLECLFAVHVPHKPYV